LTLYLLHDTLVTRTTYSIKFDVSTPYLEEVRVLIKKFFIDIKENWFAEIVWIISGISAGLLIKFIVENVF